MASCCGDWRPCWSPRHQPAWSCFARTFRRTIRTPGPPRSTRCSVRDEAAAGDWTAAVLNVARQVRGQGQSKFKRERDSAGDPVRLVALAVPGRAGECLVASFDDEASISQTALFTLQAVAVQIGAWRRPDAEAGGAALRLAALTELLGRVETAHTPREACRLLADELQSYLGCQQVVIGLCRRGFVAVAASRRCPTSMHFTPTARRHDLHRPRCKRRSRGAICRSGPPEDEGSRFGLKAHEQYASSCQAEVVVGSPLRDERGEVRGAWLMAGPRRRSVETMSCRCCVPPNRRWLPHCSCSLGHNPGGCAVCSTGCRRPDPSETGASHRGRSGDGRRVDVRTGAASREM